MKQKAPKSSRFGDRNVWCPQYARCLDQCLESGAGGFACRGCQLEHDQSGVPKDSGELAEDAADCMAVVIAVFRRVNVQQAKARMAE